MPAGGAATHELPVALGDIIAGKYRVDRVLGKGGMGLVVKATHLTLGEPVALKFVLTEHSGDPVIVERFLREARVAVKIKSEHVARVFDVSALPSGHPFIVMEYLQGRSLEEKLNQDGPLSVPDVAELMLQALEALAEAHSLGIIHRDIKPANLFISFRADRSIMLKVLDFGVSKLAEISKTGSGGGAITTGNEFLGSPSFMSPEQLVSARDVDGRTDIWAVGITMFQLLTGALPFDGETLPQLCAAILSGESRSARALLPDLPAGMEEIIARCLAHERNLRFATVADLAVALGEFAPHGSNRQIERISRITATPPIGIPTLPASTGEVVAPGLAATLPTAPRGHAGAAPREVERRRWPLLVAMGVVCAAGAGWWMFAANTSPSNRASAPPSPNGPSITADVAPGTPPAAAAPADTSTRRAQASAEQQIKLQSTAAAKTQPHKRRAAERGVHGNPLNMPIK